MMTFRDHNPETSLVHSRKSQPSKKKLRKLSDDVEVQIIDDDDDSKQLVLYNAEIAQDKEGVEVTEPIHQSSPLQQRFPKARYGHASILPSIGAYTVQCADCFKWRIVPTKEKYEELRETICEELFVCARACEWNRVLSCNDPEDMSQDGSRVWAIDKPSIAQPPPGWDRDVRIRGEGSSKFADVYYTSPSGKKLRSLVEIGRYLAENPHYIQQGASLSQFSFAIPKPLQEDYVKKRTHAAHGLPELPEVVEANPLCWAAPPTRKELLKLGTSASNPFDLDLDQPTSALNPTNLDQPGWFKSPAVHTKKRTPRYTLSPSSFPKRTLKQALSPSTAPKKRTLKQVPSPSIEHPTASSSWSLKDQPGGPPSDIEHVLL
ncbi:methyl-CpG-binding domain-containing protein 2 [Brachypodium distachyon]|uniref:MBD domain-containing protein n=1 Tax=Brachypodium distachyon TaxID=15368 RepID=I1GWQ7_BRADI|nr:methyl-CpG-binding domain-containing protein 2 [Brachypodium distachyon]KQK17413.1 hypothetical protein BRADI_1g34320v3 [Brachypodium distachyon]KQK17414.1 hypothetical protein BRADI_1g34320v3 [Brachypodium distachyon]PNT75540.1 hypothetical protein BRADI_1g34320v3 [Brachypodium distachyon]|eukprot:XP_003563518.1 methyl-CpG-binding domain-containing protein 2 [Brachypodium distachyon]